MSRPMQMIPAICVAAVCVFFAWGVGGGAHREAAEDTIQPVGGPGPGSRGATGEPLLVVSISPEARVKASLGGAAAGLVQGAWIDFPVEIENSALMTSPISIESAQRMRADDDRHRARWLKIELVPPGPLTGRREERRTVRLWSRDSGIRAAVFNVDAGQGTQDLGFRSDVLVTFDVAPSAGEREGR